MEGKKETWSLLPCPFCGGKPSLEVSPHPGNDSYNRVRITCTKCHAMSNSVMDGMAINGHITETSEAVERAVGSWNQRINKNVSSLRVMAELLEISESGRKSNGRISIP